ncbi:hypothetical protein Tco_1376783 [Tanacetum coccineum]
MRDFHKTHPSGSGKVIKIPPSAAKIKPSIINEGTGVEPGVPNVTEEETTESEAESWVRDKNDSNNDHNSSGEGSDQESDSGDDNTQSDKEKWSNSEQETDENEMGSESDQQENEEEIKDDEDEDESDEDETNEESKVEDDEDDEDKGMDYTTNQFDDDVDVRLNNPVHADDGFVKKEGTDAEMINKTEVLVTSSSHSSNLASKLLNFADIAPIDVEIVSPMDVHPVYTIVFPQSLPSFTPPPTLSTPTPQPTTKATNPLSTLPDFASVFQFNNRVSDLEKEVFELRMDDPLNTQVTALVDEHLDSRLGATREEFMSYLLASITARIIERVKT